MRQAARLNRPALWFVSRVSVDTRNAPTRKLKASLQRSVRQGNRPDRDVVKTLHSRQRRSKNGFALSLNRLRALFAPRGFPVWRQGARPEVRLCSPTKRECKGVELVVFSDVACSPSTPVGVGCSPKDCFHFRVPCDILHVSCGQL